MTTVSGMLWKGRTRHLTAARRRANDAGIVGRDGRRIVGDGATAVEVVSVEWRRSPRGETADSKRQV